ncbi:MAG TPA: hypothetical protein DEQ26_08545 [Flavobacteriaceae bacterium]|nr:hypothetical protein [Flavobacteriaceae bacterium]
MKMRFFLYSTFIVALFLNSFSFAQVTPVNIVKEKPTLDQILNHIQAKGVKLSNPRLLSGNIDKQVLTFENGYNANFEIDKGLVISTGNAKEDVLSRNLSPSKSSPNTGQYNDSDLTNIDNQAIYNTFVLEFDVVLDPGLTALRVAFQFGSEEYPDYVVGQYNDVFGFFVKGPGISGTKNMARLPSNNKPITINNINYGKYGGNSGAWSSPLKPTDLSQSDLYINNGHTTKIYSNTYPNMLMANINDADLKNYKRDIYIEWNGLTKLITYDLKNLIPGEKYTFKIAIADVSDTTMESGVIIEKIQGVDGSDLVVEKNLVEDKAYIPGDLIEFKIKSKNLGPYINTDAVVEDILPSGYEYISHTITPNFGNYINGKWTIGTLKVAVDEPELIVKAKVLPSGEYKNTAIIKSSKFDPDLSNNTATVYPEIKGAKKNRMISNPMIFIK